MKRPTVFKTFSKLVSNCTHLSNLFLKIFENKWLPLQNIKKLISIFATLNNFSKKTYEKTYRFYDTLKFLVKLYTFIKFDYLEFFFLKKRHFLEINKEINTNFLTLNNFCQITHLNTYRFYDTVSKFMLICTLSQNFVI